MRITGRVGYAAGMTRSFFIACVVATLSALLSPQAHAWGPLGHRLVGHLAERELSPKARAEVARLLRGEAEPTLAGVANWADDLRGNDPGLGRRSSPWHYVNLAEDGCRYDATRDCRRGDCVVEAIRRQRAILADRSKPAAARAQALKFIVHFVGDIHQPLHAGHAHDRGGNDVQINLDGKGSNLHRLWDSELLATAKLPEPDYLRRLRKLPSPASTGIEPARWAEASCRVVLREGFMPPRAKIGQDYVLRWRPVAEDRLRQAGHALATLLNDTLK
jgi:hypothetical protein